MPTLCPNKESFRARKPRRPGATVDIHYTPQSSEHGQHLDLPQTTDLWNNDGVVECHDGLLYRCRLLVSDGPDVGIRQPRPASKHASYILVSGLAAGKAVAY